MQRGIFQRVTSVAVDLPDLNTLDSDALKALVLEKHALIVEIGVDCAVVAFTILALQFVIAARLLWIEAPFGLDVVFQFHRAMALVAMGLLCIHPLLVAAGESWVLLTSWHVHWPVICSTRKMRSLAST